MLIINKVNSVIDVLVLHHARGITRPNMTQQVGRAQHGPTYNGPICFYLGSASLVAGHRKHLAGPMLCCRYAYASYRV